MCNKDCCALKTALDIRRMKLLIEQRRQEAANAKLKPIIATPESLIFSYEDIQKMANVIINKTQQRPKFGLVCGNHLDMLVSVIENPIVINYSDIPKFPQCIARKNKLFVGTVMGSSVIAMQGRFHSYEGNPLAACALPMRVMKLCGVEYVLLSCASGGVHKTYNVGDILLIQDHINFFGLFGRSPLYGPNENRFGKTHFAMINAYDSELVAKALEIASEIGEETRIHAGIYACLGGPSYETLAEHRFLRNIGVDAVGMALVHEVIYARHCGLKVFAFGLITVPPLDNPSDVAENETRIQLGRGQQICCELVARLIYKIENNL